MRDAQKCPSQSNTTCTFFKITQDAKLYSEMFYEGKIYGKTTIENETAF